MKRCPVLVEREAELATLGALVAGSGPLVALVTGEAGTGKSRLAQELVAMLPAGWSVRTLRLTRTASAGPSLPPDRPLLAIVDDAHFLEPAALREGVTLAEFAATLRSNPDAAIEMAHLDGGASLTPGVQRRAVTFDLRPSSTYVVVNLTGENPADWEIADFTTVSTANGATATAADARVRIVDLRFRGAKRLPLNGVVRFENAGWAPHFAFAAPLKRGARPRAVGRALRRNQERKLGRLVDFERGVEPQALITRGAVNYNEVRFPRR